MTKESNPTFVGWHGIILVAIVIAAGLSTPAHCQTPDVALLLQQSPAKGGIVTPIAGVHHFTPHSEVTLSANPKPGYQFLHWLGDVSDPTANSTVVYVDKPKIVIAVYEQIEQNILEAGSGPGGGISGGLFATAADYNRSSSLSYGGSSGNSKPKYKRLKYSLVDGSESTPEVPEPATGVLLGLGAIFAFAKRSMKRRRHSNL